MTEELEWRKQDAQGLCWACNGEQAIAWGLYDRVRLLGWVCDLHSRKGLAQVQTDLGKVIANTESEERVHNLHLFSQAISMLGMWPPPVDREEPEDISMSTEEHVDRGRGK